MSVFFSGFMGNESELGTNTSCEPEEVLTICLFRAPIHSPMNPEKKTLIPYINNVSNKDPS